MQRGCLFARRGHGDPPRARLLGAVLGSALVLALVTVGCSSASTPALSSSGAGQPAGQAAGPVWLCQPGQAIDPCNYNLAATAVTAAGTLEPATWPRSATASKFDCFYVHPTDSLAKTANTTLAATKADLVVAVEQAAPLSQLCNVW